MHKVLPSGSTFLVRVYYEDFDVAFSWGDD